MIARRLCSIGAVLVAATAVVAVDIDVNDETSIKNAAQSIAQGLAQQYPHGSPGDIPGILPEPYYWFTSGLMFNTLIEYAYFTGDTQYEQITTEALLFQRGDDDDYQPVNQTRTMGNDDQGLWALAALIAAERNVESGDGPSWINLAQNVYSNLVARWDEATCGGGLRWQVFAFNNGYNYKNGLSNAVFFTLASRLARFTNDDDHVEWAGKAWDWMQQVGIIDSETFAIYDGTNVETDCNLVAKSDGVSTQTTSDEWRDRVDKLVNSLDEFFDSDNIMYESACEPFGTCNDDQKGFKSALARGVGSAIQLAPFTQDRLLPRLTASAEAAAKQCNDEEDQFCSFIWASDASDGDPSQVGTHMNALSTIQNLLSARSSPPSTTENANGESDEDDSTNPDDGGLESSSTDPAGPSPTGAGSNVAASLSLVWAISSILVLHRMSW